MDQWKKLMEEGNEHYNLKQWEEALTYYNQAIALLETAISVEPYNAQQSIQGWVCGYHNLSTTYERQGFIVRSRDALVIPFRTMLALANDVNISPEMQLISHRALQITLPPLLEFGKKFPSELEFIKRLVGHITTDKNLH